MKRIALVCASSLALAACDTPMTESPPPRQLTLDAQLRQSLGMWGAVPIGPMPAQDPELVALGRALFFDPILSGNRDISCATCHHPTAALGDRLPLSIGTGGTGLGSSRRLGAGRQFVPRSAPSLLNAGLGLTYLMWDARLSRFPQPSPDPVLPPLPAGGDVLAAQPLLAVTNRHEMLGNPGDVDVFGNPNELASLGSGLEISLAIMRRLLAIPEYAALFNSAFPGRPLDALRFADAATALVTFQKQAFVRTNSPFDRYLDRDDNALTSEQKRGALLFFGRAQCGSCHGGPFLGGQTFANVGAPQLGPGGQKQPPLDLGRGEVQDQTFYRFMFRVPPLRNVELTAPYMHSGAYSTLEAVVQHYDDVPLALRSYDASQHAPSLANMHHGDDATHNAILANLDHRLRTPLRLTATEVQELIAFLKALTDPAARDLASVTPARVPSGLPVQ